MFASHRSWEADAKSMNVSVFKYVQAVPRHVHRHMLAKQKSSRDTRSNNASSSNHNHVYLR